MKWKREREKKKYMMRNKIMWKRERNTDTKLKRVGGENIKHKLMGTPPPLLIQLMRPEIGEKVVLLGKKRTLLLFDISTNPHFRNVTIS